MPAYSEAERYSRIFHPALDTWSLMRGPFPTFSIAAGYLFFVLKLGPQFMADRQPIALQKFLVVFNFFLIMANAALAVWPFLYGEFRHMATEGLCHHANPPSEELVYSTTAYLWWFQVMKILELSDTIFFVLRKKLKQVTPFHVTHHGSMAITPWLTARMLRGDQYVVPIFINSSVHVFMYTYYLISALGPKYQKYVWWKKYLAVMEMVQFILMITNSSYLLLFNCDSPRGLSVYYIMLSVLYFILFVQSLRKQYKKKASD